MNSHHWNCGADLVVKQLEQHGVKQILGSPEPKLTVFLILWLIQQLKLLLCVTKPMRLLWRVR